MFPFTFPEVQPEGHDSGTNTAADDYLKRPREPIWHKQQFFIAAKRSDWLPERLFSFKTDTDARCRRIT
jgi:hypothetical protein